MWATACGRLPERLPPLAVELRRDGERPVVPASGALSIAAQFYCEVRQAFRVPPTCFRPKPQVGSAVVVLTPLPKPRVSVADEAFFFRIVRAGFAHRRKALPNSLRDEGLQGRPAAAALKQAGIDPRRRAETLSIEEFAALTDTLLSLS